VETSLGSQLLVGQEVDQGSVLDKGVFLVKSGVFELLSGVSQMVVLNQFDCISPLVGKLKKLVLGIDTIENREFGTNQVGKMSHFGETNIESDKELMLEEHTFNPVVGLPSATLEDGGDACGVCKQEKEASS